MNIVEARSNKSKGAYISVLRRLVSPVLLTAVVLLSFDLYAQDIEILWDTSGVPHIYAKDDEDAFFGMGWAQAESYGDLLLGSYLQSRGEASRFLGEGSHDSKGRASLDSDKWNRTLNVVSVAQNWERQQTPAFSRNLKSWHSLNLRGRIVVPAAVISGGKNESIYVLSNRCCSSAAFRGRTYTRLSPV